MNFTQIPAFWLLCAANGTNYHEIFVNLQIFNKICLRILSKKFFKKFVLFCLLFFRVDYNGKCNRLQQPFTYQSAHHFPPYHTKAAQTSGLRRLCHFCPLFLPAPRGGLNHRAQRARRNRRHKRRKQRYSYRPHKALCFQSRKIYRRNVEHRL